MQQRYIINQGDVLAVLKTLPADFFDACLSDPPYGISFMGKEWDKGVPSADVYTELLRVMKPGAMGLHFGGTRMWHRLAVNLEDAGFQLRDTVMWLYGSGFPKSHNISKALDKAAGAEREVVGERKQRGKPATDAPFQKNTSPSAVELLTAPATPTAKLWDGYGTALKPAWEPALLVQKPMAGTFANNVLVHGCGALNVDGARVGTEVITQSRTEMKTWREREGRQDIPASADNSHTTTQGRFPANLIIDEEAGQALGGASRFFYCAKVSTKERNAGCGKLADVTAGCGASSPIAQGATARNNHPTLKPLALTEYLARLLLAPARTDGQPRRLLVPFSGAGSELIGALKAGWDEVWGIELDGDYVRIASARIEHHTGAVLLETLAEAA